MRGCLPDWISDFLTGTTQTVVLEGWHSSQAPVSSWIPQGTVLGPLLFSVYINDMPGCINSTARLFADDCLIIVSSNKNSSQSSEMGG